LSARARGCWRHRERAAATTIAFHPGVTPGLGGPAGFFWQSHPGPVDTGL